MAIRNSLDRSTMFTCLLDLSPEFGRLDSVEGREVVTKAVAAWLDYPGLDMYAFARIWLSANPLPTAPPTEESV